MRRPARFCLALSLFAVSASAEAGRHLVLVSIDGLMPSAYTRPDELGLTVPNLRRMAAAGAFARGVVGVLPSVTYPSHTTLITGVSPRVHGITSNKVVDPKGASNSAWRWYAREVRLPSLVDAARARKLARQSEAPLPGLVALAEPAARR